MRAVKVWAKPKINTPYRLEIKSKIVRGLEVEIMKSNKKEKVG